MAITSGTSTDLRCSEDIRCHCGQLIAPVVEAGLEVKCKRCRHLFVISFSNIGGWRSRVNNVLSRDYS
jgi:phage FluMu protein Com